MNDVHQETVKSQAIGYFQKQNMDTKSVVCDDGTGRESMYTTSQPMYDLDSFVMYLFFPVFLQKETILSILHTGDNTYLQNPKHLQYALLKTMCDVSLFTKVEKSAQSGVSKGFVFTSVYCLLQI